MRTTWIQSRSDQQQSGETGHSTNSERTALIIIADRPGRYKSLFTMLLMGVGFDATHRGANDDKDINEEEEEKQGTSVVPIFQGAAG